MYDVDGKVFLVVIQSNGWRQGCAAHQCRSGGIILALD